MNCENCGNYHDGTYGSGRFCSSKCARGFSTKHKRAEINEKVSKKLKGLVPSNKGKFLIERTTRHCKTCNNIFTVKINSTKEYCCGKCNPKCGGYREGSGRAKTGYYKGIYCGSTYELVWVIYRLDHNLSVKRFDGCIEGNGIKYFPDFIENNTIIELKGYENKESVDKKTMLAKYHGYDVVLIYKENLTKEFDWVKRNYNVSNFEELYDDYSPKYEYICCGCGNTFYANKKRKTTRVFCSRKCIKPVGTANKKGIN